MKRALLYLIPFAWLGPYLDWKVGSIFGYALFLFGLGVLSYSLARSGKPKHIVIGNMVTFAISYGIALSLAEGYGEGYFKPLTVSQLVLGLSVLNLVVQIPIVMNAIQNKVMKKELEGHDG
ncbi:hypothetical protein [Exiguobacterium acetylicum]|uniref:hypothetical protein n=1 Tax=Exiguobacterium acetylicum TaxID=41170 RepID=UPI001EE30589|nr:hypothetical protein [Exiguobacterium acetylicum]UKS56398.1 hypothetical protein K6T22_01830 [Exiguobacterium acetylicum]